jgi:hypothetical protein
MFLLPFSTLIYLACIICAARNAHANCRIDQLTSELVCDGFKSWHDLKQMLNSTNKSSLAISIPFFNIHPAESIMLTSELDLAALAEAMESITNQRHLYLNILSIDGIDLTAWSNAVTASLILISLESSQIKFNINGSSSFQCSKNLIQLLLNTKSSTFFNSISSIQFRK